MNYYKGAFLYFCLDFIFTMNVEEITVLHNEVTKLDSSHNYNYSIQILNNCLAW